VAVSEAVEAEDSEGAGLEVEAVVFVGDLHDQVEDHMEELVLDEL
jgi:hypothetical protein